MITNQLQSLAAPVSSLRLDPSNVRRHDEKNLKAIKDSLLKFGQQIYCFRLELNERFR